MTDPVDRPIRFIAIVLSCMVALVAVVLVSATVSEHRRCSMIGEFSSYETRWSGGWMSGECYVYDGGWIPLSQWRGLGETP